MRPRTSNLLAILASSWTASAFTSRATAFPKLKRCFHMTQFVLRDPSSVDHTPSEEEPMQPPPNSDEDPEKSTFSKVYPAKSKRNHRFRQHVNPLAAKFQVPTKLSSSWSSESYRDPSLPLFLDIGCAKGGFLLQYATLEKEKGLSKPKQNYLGLEIRPSVAEFAQSRVPKWKLDGHLNFIGCNVNVDLKRILECYATTMSSDGKKPIECVAIQFPDPHFKNRHTKRRVVNQELVHTLARFMEEDTKVFLQSDIKDVLDNMRERFREESVYFEDVVENSEEYLDHNPLGLPTEREISVLDKGLPVYRTLFRRTGVELSD